MSDTDHFYLEQNEPNKSCLLALRDIINKQDELVHETKKYGMPCFCYKNKMFCYLWTDNKTNDPYILFVEGKHLKHPELETGDRVRMKLLRVDPKKDIPLKTIEMLLNDAITLYRNGTIKTR